MDKAINILGIGTDNLLKIPTNESGEMVTEELETTLRKVLDTGGLPFFVSATAGTTVRGAYDPIPPLLELRQKYGFWLHVDGAWGGAAIMSDRLREKYLTGLEETDSFTCDFHKMLGSALMCNFLLINNSKTNFSKVISGGDGSYLFRDTEDDTVPDLGNLSLQCGRRVDALKWFLDWKYYGQEGFGDRIEKYLELCEFAEQIISETPKLELVAPRTSFNVCFRYVPSSGDANTFNEKLRTDLYTEGQALVGLAYIGNTLTMRLLIVNQSVEQPHIRTFFDRVLEKGNHMESESA